MSYSAQEERPLVSQTGAHGDCQGVVYDFSDGTQIRVDMESRVPIYLDVLNAGGYYSGLAALCSGNKYEVCATFTQVNAEGTQRSTKHPLVVVSGPLLATEKVTS